MPTPKQNSGKPFSLEPGSRRLIIVAPDEAVGAARALSSASIAMFADPQRSGLAGAMLGLAYAGGLRTAGLALGAAAALAKDTYDSWGAGKLDDLNIQQVSLTEANALKMPAGKPVVGTVYAPHPCVDGVYYPVASFHHQVFLDKVANANRLLRCLGATDTKIDSVHGWDKNFDANLTGQVGVVDVGGEAGRSTTSSSNAEFEATYGGDREPFVPEDLRWFAQEPLWQEIAEGRLQHGMRNFSLTVTYNEDHKINAGLKVKLEKAGLDIGGAFQNHVATTWRMSGTFSDGKPA